MHEKSITDSKLHAVVHINDDAAGRAPCNWWFSKVSRSAALAPVNEECRSAAHFIWLLRIQIEGARSSDWGFVHRILAVAQFVLCCWQGTYVGNTLKIGVHVTFTCA